MCQSKDSLERLHNRLAVIWRDNSSGSSQLQQSLESSFIEFFDSAKNRNLPSLLELLHQSQLRLSHFALVSHFQGFVLGELKKGVFGSEMVRSIRLYSEKWNSAKDSLYRNCLKAFDFRNKTVLLHSNSGTIIEFLLWMNKNLRPERIIQTESRPILEGRLQAKTLLENGFQVSFATDLAAISLMPLANLLLTGSDKVYKDYFINKTGTLALALAAKTFQKEVVVLADSRKLVDKNYTGPAVLNTHETDEVWDYRHEKLKIENYYLEAIPIKLASAVITDQEIKRITS